VTRKKGGDMESVFSLNKYLISQKIITMRGKYHIFTEAGEKILYVEQTALVQIKPEFNVYKDESKREKVLSFQKDKWLQLAPSYTIKDAGGQIIGKVKKKLFALIKSMWDLYDSQGRELANIQQDTTSVVLGMMTKSGKELANFNFIAQGRQIGSLNRKWHVADRYLLDLSGDQNMQIDRRLAVCASIVLDVGEGR
jgi:uncharacterized protein YxjI